MLLCWSRRDTYTLGFGPFPVIFSINLFLWFKPDWFYLQFADGGGRLRGQRADPLGQGRTAGAHLQSLVVSARGLFARLCSRPARATSRGARSIANTQFYPPHMYLMMFLIGLPGQFLFGVTTMTMSAVVTTYLFGLLYFAATGIYFFYDSYIPIAVFLGMHLLFTDPSTSPRTELGRIMFGALYGLSTVALVPAAWQRGHAHLLRQASAGAALEPVDQVDRSRRALQDCSGRSTLRRSADRLRHVSATWRTCPSGRSCLRS